MIDIEEIEKFRNITFPSYKKLAMIKSGMSGKIISILKTQKRVFSDNLDYFNYRLSTGVNPDSEKMIKKRIEEEEDKLKQVKCKLWEL